MKKVDYQDIAEDVRSMIAQDQIEDVLEKLSVVLKDQPELDEVILQSAQFKEVNAEIRQNLISDELASRKVSMIRKALLGLAREIEKKGKRKKDRFYQLFTR